MRTDQALPDTEHAALTRTGAFRPYIMLARLDRPIGWWLLFWPCAWGVSLAGAGFARFDLILWMLLGAIAMRGAGCVYNDIIDRDLDAQVERTRGRPLASGAVSLKAAWAWLLALCIVGLLVWWQLELRAKAMALCAIPLIAIYPFTKRFTWWPQLWLGLVFGSGAVIGFFAAPHEMVKFPAEYAGMWLAVKCLYAGAIAWVIGYDTIYALQDREDDALVGIRSSALRLGRHVRLGVAGFYAIALVLWSTAIWSIRPEPLAFVALVPAAMQLGWQVLTLNPEDGNDALAKFRSNRFAGLLVFLACLTVGTGAA